MKAQSIKLSEGDILKRYAEMEKKFGRREGRNYFPSLDFYLNYYEDKESSIREEANKMIEFAGLGTYRSNISFKELDGAAGNIVLNNDMIAEITIDKKVSNSIDSVMATLAHEICHKVLFKYGIYFKGFYNTENEIYADLATFYVGFGDLTMKGYQVGDSLSGYLTPDTYAMAYYLMTVINKEVTYNINTLPPHAKAEIEKASKKCELSKTKFVELDRNNISQIYSESFTEIRKLYEFYDMLLAILPMMIDRLSVICKKVSNAFYDFDTKELEWHKFSIAYHAFLYTKANEKDNHLLNLYKDKFGAAFYNIYEAVKDDVIISEIQRHCPTCGYIINKKLDPREYHLICPHCKTHFTVNGDISIIKNDIASLEKKRTDLEGKYIGLTNENKHLKELVENLKQDNSKMQDEVNRLNQLFDYESHAHEDVLEALRKENKQLKEKLDKGILNRIKRFTSNK